jgi:hypothetical protein
VDVEKIPAGSDLCIKANWANAECPNRGRDKISQANFMPMQLYLSKVAPSFLIGVILNSENQVYLNFRQKN